MLDLTPITTPLMQIAGAVLAGWGALYLPRLIATLERRTGVQISDQQKQQLMSVVSTFAGQLETKLDQGVMDVSHVEVGNEHVQQAAAQAVAVLTAMGNALPISKQDVANLIVGAADTTPRKL